MTSLPWTIILSSLDDNIIVLDEDGTEFDFQKQNIIVLGRLYYRPWTSMGWNPIPRNKISSCLDDNVIVPGRGRDGNVLALDDNIIVLGR